MHPLILAAAHSAADLSEQCVDTNTFPLWLRVTHLINFLFMGMLIRSGIEIIASHPRFYLNDHCTPGSEWIRFTRDKVPMEEGAFTARDDQRSLSPVIALPGRAKIGLGRAWHGIATSFWMLNGLVYVVLLFATGAWRRLVPTTWQILPDAWDSLLTYLTTCPSGPAGTSTCALPLCATSPPTTHSSSWATSPSSSSPHR